LFLNEENFNFHLTEYSPCIDAGYNDYSFFNFDFDKNVRICDGNGDENAIIDIGAFEYNAPVYISDEKEKHNDFSIIAYPNPTNGIVSIEFADNSIKKIIICDITGKKTIEKTEIKENEQFDLSSYGSGIYIISIQTDNEIFTTKIIKN
jgi:hypothetical protein